MNKIASVGLTILGIGISVVAAAATIAAIGWIVLRRNGSREFPELPDGMTIDDCETLDIESVVSWARERGDILRANKDLACVVFRIPPDDLRKAVAERTGGPGGAPCDTQGDCGTLIAVYDNVHNRIVTGHCRLVISRNRSEDLDSTFGDKQMIVLQ